MPCKLTALGGLAHVNALSTVPKVNRVMDRHARPLDHAQRNAHISQESHRLKLLRRDYFFLGQPRRVGQCLLNILDFEVGVVG